MTGPAAPTAIDPESFRDPAVALDPYPLYARLRAADPVHWNEASRAWFVTRYEDVAALLTDRRLGARTSSVVLSAVPVDSRADVEAMEHFLGRWMVFADAPYQTRVRRAVAPAFAPPAVAELTPLLRRRAAEHVSRFAVGGGDLVADLARPYALAVISDILGCRPDEHDALVSWSETIMEYVTSPVDPLLAQRARAAVSALRAHVLKVVLPRGEGLVARTLAAATGLGELTEDEAVATFTQLLTGGVEPVGVAVALCVTALHEHEDVLAAARGGTPAWSRVVEEAFRHDAPFHFAPRRVLEDFALHGRLLRRGQRVALVLASANRDERRFSRPDVFDPRRPETGHLAFGKGGHYCLGAALARVEAEALVRELDDRLPGLRMAGPAERAPAFGATVLRTAPALL